MTGISSFMRYPQKLAGLRREGGAAGKGRTAKPQMVIQD
jgi:hypothetical protein